MSVMRGRTDSQRIHRHFSVWPNSDIEGQRQSVNKCSELWPEPFP
jgi:hypothetical protein